MTFKLLLPFHYRDHKLSKVRTINTGKAVSPTYHKVDVGELSIFIK